MKALQCSICGTDAQLPDGRLYLIGRAPTFHRSLPFRYECHRCGHPNEVTAEEYTRLPEASREKLQEAGVRV